MQKIQGNPQKPIHIELYAAKNINNADDSIENIV